MRVRQASEADDRALVRHYLALWESYGTPPDHIEADADEAVLRFIEDGRRHRRLGVFLAEEGGVVTGSVACQLHISPYPEVTKPRFRKLGYVWCVFVESGYRGRGVGRMLMERALRHLQEIGCTGAVLHSSEAGEPLYLSLGFTPAKEMRLPLDGTADLPAGLLPSPSPAP